MKYNNRHDLNLAPNARGMSLKPKGKNKMAKKSRNKLKHKRRILLTSDLVVSTQSLMGIDSTPIPSSSSSMGHGFLNIASSAPQTISGPSSRYKTNSQKTTTSIHRHQYMNDRDESLSSRSSNNAEFISSFVNNVSNHAYSGYGAGSGSGSGRPLSAGVEGVYNRALASASGAGSYAQFPADQTLSSNISSAITTNTTAAHPVSNSRPSTAAAANLHRPPVAPPPSQSFNSRASFSENPSISSKGITPSSVSGVSSPTLTASTPPHSNSTCQKSSSSSACNTSTPLVDINQQNIIIHVFDESRNSRRDFHCKRHLLVREMKYFEEALADKQSQNMIDIDVYVSIKHFTFFYWKRHIVSYISSQNSKKVRR